MKRDHEFGKPYRRRDGQIGAPVRMRIEHGGWHANYSFDSHGMSSSDVAKKLDDLAAYHEKKSACMTRFRGVQGVEIENGDDTYRIVDCTVFDKAVTLYVDVRRVTAGVFKGQQREMLVPVQGFPMTTKYRDITQVPSNEAILAMIRENLPDDEPLEAAHNEFVKKVREKVKGGA